MNHITNKQRQTLLKEDEVIVLYKRGSRGEIVGVHDCIQDIVDLNKPFWNKFHNAVVYSSLVGRTKSFASFYHGCRCTARVKKRSEVQWP